MSVAVDLQSLDLSPARPTSGNFRGFVWHEVQRQGGWLAVLPRVDGWFRDVCHQPTKRDFCPKHGGQSGQAFFLFGDVNETGGGGCNTCGNFGDGFKLIAWLTECSEELAVQKVADALGLSRSHPSNDIPPQNPATNTPSDSTDISDSALTAAPPPSSPEIPEPIKVVPAKEITLERSKLVASWQTATPDTGILATYLLSRGITIPVPPNLRVHLDCPYWDGDRQSGAFPAMIARFMRAGTFLTGLHTTWLAKDGNGKANVSNPKKSRTIYKSALVGSSIQLYQAKQGIPLAVTEGIETGLAVRQATGLPVWAAGNQRLLRAIEIPPQYHEIHIWGDWNSSGVGEEAAREAAERLTAEGHTVKILIPIVPAPDDSDGAVKAGDDAVDWLDILNRDGPDALKFALEVAEVWQPKADQRSDAIPAGTFAIGSYVSPDDKNNWGTVVAAHGDGSYDVSFTSQAGVTVVKNFKAERLKGQHADYKSVKPSRKLAFESSPVFFAKKFKMEWLVEKLLPVAQVGGAYGPDKSMKTAIFGIELPIALASGTPFLGHWRVPQKRTVGVISGESGGFAIQQRAREICYSRGIIPSDLSIHWEYNNLPQISEPEELAEIASWIKELKLELLCIDPAYMTLLTQATAHTASNVFAMGCLLRGLTNVCNDTGCSIMLIHHTRKPDRNEDKYKPLDADAISMSGFKEWSRFRYLVNHRREYQHDGIHDLWVKVEGSLGFGGTNTVHINEGVINDDFTGKHWHVKTEKAHAAIENEKSGKETTKAKDHADRILKALTHEPDGLTRNQLRDQTGLNSPTLAPAILELQEQGLIEAIVVKRGKKDCDAVRLKK